MTYEPTTRPVFPGDDWHKLRDEQHMFRMDIIARIGGIVGRHFQRAAIVLGQEDDPVARELRAEQWFDVHALSVAHAHLAAFWRLKMGHTQPRLEGMTNLFHLFDEWEKWVRGEAGVWFLDNPKLLRLFALVFAKWQTRETVIHEMDLWDELKSYYPLPRPEHPDFFDDPKSYTPYP